ncbi:hypothetical protein BDP27DRAFT_327949 [Rhodocollybia butyracea]|uniref:Uncharacterized protein n=1 Tax=Rhodocollybia butyracea TaxID=206335 RepID=A0A9P5PEB3_9AGAR|nr:hypothetical protein BDP27DRAFT_327949 [Rhodocollybia butyracea]
MRSTSLLLLTLLAASSILLAVFPMPVPGRKKLEVSSIHALKNGASDEHTSKPKPKNTITSKPRETKEIVSALKVTITLISRLNETLDGTTNAGEQKFLSQAIFNEGFSIEVRRLNKEYKGRYLPDETGPNPLWKWGYYTLTDFKHKNLDCTKVEPCYGWIARSDKFRPYTTPSGQRVARRCKLTGKPNSGRMYAGIGPGPLPWITDKVHGKPALDKNPTTDNRVVTEAQQKEWDVLLLEFNKRFMNETFNPLDAVHGRIIEDATEGRDGTHSSSPEVDDGMSEISSTEDWLLPFERHELMNPNFNPNVHGESIEHAAEGHHDDRAQSLLREAKPNMSQMGSSSTMYQTESPSAESLLGLSPSDLHALGPPHI